VPIARDLVDVAVQNGTRFRHQALIVGTGAINHGARKQDELLNACAGALAQYRFGVCQIKPAPANGRRIDDRVYALFFEKAGVTAAEMSAKAIFLLRGSLAHFNQRRSVQTSDN
jgi:hypothetical protein